MGLFNRTKDETVTETPSVAVEDISGDYTLDPSHTRIGFSARHAMVTKVRGHFDEFEGSAHVDTADAGQLLGHGHHPGRQRHHRQRAARRSPQDPRLLRHRQLPADHLRLDRTSSATAPSGPSPAT